MRYLCVCSDSWKPISVSSVTTFLCLSSPRVPASCIMFTGLRTQFWGNGTCSNQRPDLSHTHTHTHVSLHLPVQSHSFSLQSHVTHIPGCVSPLIVSLQREWLWVTSGCGAPWAAAHCSVCVCVCVWGWEHRWDLGQWACSDDAQKHKQPKTKKKNPTGDVLDFFFFTFST